LRFELRRDVESFERYHERLYLPHLRRSQGASAVPLSRTKHRSAFDRGELLLVFGAETEPIAGAVLTEGRELPRIRSLGMADEVPFALQRDAGPAVYVFAMQRLRERGFSAVSFGRSRAFLDDGVLTFKNKWSHRVESGSARGFAMKLLRPGRGLARFLAANPFVFERQGMHAALFSAEVHSVEAREALLHRRHIRGLASVQLFSTDGRPVEAEAPRRDRVSPPDALTHAVDVLLRQLLRLHARERLLVYSARPADDPLLRALTLNAEEIGARPEVLHLSSSGHRGEHGAAVARALRNRGYDAAIELSPDSLYLTAAWNVAHAIGCRIYSIAGLDAESFVRCVGEVDHVRTWAFGTALRDRIVRSREIRVHCARGTDLRMRLRSLVPRVRRGFFGTPCGRLKHERDATFLSGQIAFRGVRSSFEGVAVVDGCLAPPDDVGRLRSPLELRFARGTLADMNGSAKVIDSLRAWLGTDAARLEHLCLGFNAGARISDSALESERVFGALTVGFGEGPRHTDAVITRPTIELDREPLEVEGRFVLELLRRDQRRLLSERDSDP
jgi:leucyl aminopeptidase (aminopeptidase T)